MDQQPSGTAPNAGSVLKFVASRVWRSKWLIGAATVIAAAATFALYQPDANQAWTGKTTLRIGVAPPADYVLAGSGSPLTPIETPRNTVARLSDPIFRNKVVNQAAFESPTSAFSKAMVSSSLRGISGESDRDVTVELTAGSAADVKAAFSALAEEISRVHGDIMKRRLQLLQAKSDDAKRRIALIETSSAVIGNRLLGTGSDDKAQPNPSASTENFAVLVPAWHGLQDRVQNDTSLAQLSEPSALNLDVNTYFLASRSLGTLRASLLTGLSMLIAMIILTIIVGTPARVSAD
jgi:hypothetical protein